jgi:hypothetical protein
MSNIFLSTSFIYLASKDAGCQMDVTDEGDQEQQDCNNNIYGMTPTSLIANIAIVSGLLSAFLMPIAGAMIDFTPYRRETGILSAIFMIAIQAIQIGTVQATWFPMAILQAIAGFLYQVQVLATFAYLPEIARSVGQTKLTYCTYIHLTMLYFPLHLLSFSLTYTTINISSIYLYNCSIYFPGSLSGYHHCDWVATSFQ